MDLTTTPVITLSSTPTDGKTPGADWHPSCVQRLLGRLSSADLAKLLSGRTLHFSNVTWRLSLVDRMADDPERFDWSTVRPMLNAR